MRNCCLSLNLTWCDVEIAQDVIQRRSAPDGCPCPEALETNTRAQGAASSLEMWTVPAEIRKAGFLAPNDPNFLPKHDGVRVGHIDLEAQRGVLSRAR